MNWKCLFGKPGIGQARDTEPGDIRDPGLDKAVAEVRRSDLSKAIDILKTVNGVNWDDDTV